MRTQPGKIRSLAPVGRHYESTRLGGQVIAAAYELLVPTLTRSTQPLAGRGPATRTKDGSHPRPSAIGA
jgi:hypothetical protein